MFSCVLCRSKFSSINMKRKPERLTDSLGVAIETSKKSLNCHFRVWNFAESFRCTHKLWVVHGNLSGWWKTQSFKISTSFRISFQSFRHDFELNCAFYEFIENGRETLRKVWQKFDVHSWPEKIDQSLPLRMLTRSLFLAKLHQFFQVPSFFKFCPNVFAIVHRKSITHF